MPDSSFVNGDPWKRIEDSVARDTSTPLLPTDEFEAQALCREIASSRFSDEEVRALVHTDADLLARFALAWIRHNRGIDYGEDWDSDEGDQQSSANSNPSGSTFVRGFLVTSAIMLLYASRAPAELHDYLAARKVPKPNLVREDVMRIYESVRR